MLPLISFSLIPHTFFCAIELVQLAVARNAEVVELLLRRKDIKVNTFAEKGWSPLLLALKTGNNTDGVVYRHYCLLNLH